MRRLAFVSALLLLGCDDRASRPVSADGVRQDGVAAPQGAVPRGARALRADLAAPASVDRAAGALGYRDFCAPCHGVEGAGDGTVIAHGFTAPRPFAALTPAERASPRTVAIITRGYGAMLSQADQVPPRERWAIAAHVEQLAARGTSDVR